ncbi:MAG: FAD-binding oxidoreductase [Deltaproteobacteria bacterium]|nr:MAG: FAD-binding oxidoreductase [Deltaproteobacteria bacterium]
MRQGLHAQIAAFLGVQPRPEREPPPVDTLDLPAPRIEPPPALAGITSTDRADRARHTYGRSYPDLVRGLAGDFRQAPDLILRPESEDQVAQVLAWAAGPGVAVIPFGGGTSVVGGVEYDGATRPGVVSLDMTRMDRVLEVRPTSLLARIQAGAKGPRLEAQLAEHGLTLRHYPQSFEFSTLGGWIATRAGGHFATVYTHIDDLVASCRMITPQGPWESARLPGSGAGPSPDRLVLGSEGTLGVITEAWMRVFPRPTFRGRASIRFEDWRDAVEATRAIAQARHFPSNCRLLDKREAMLNMVPANAGHVLLLGFESADAPVGHALDRCIQIAKDHGGTLLDGPHLREGEGRDGGAGDRWREAFLQAPYLQSALVTMGVMVDTFETAIPWDGFEALHDDVVRSVRAALKEHCGTGLLTCRFTHVYPDGPAPYYTFLGPVAEGRELQSWRAVKAAASDALVRHGATITHHHAVGRVHRPWYDQQRPELFAEGLRAVKRTLDPAGVLNPGVLIEER